MIVVMRSPTAPHATLLMRYGSRLLFVSSTPNTHTLTTHAVTPLLKRKDSVAFRYCFRRFSLVCRRSRCPL